MYKQTVRETPSRTIEAHMLEYNTYWLMPICKYIYSKVLFLLKMDAISICPFEYEFKSRIE